MCCAYPRRVRESASTSLQLAGSILIAHPSLLDPNFRKSVILLADHNAKDGGFGLIVNRPTGKVVGDFLKENEMGQLARVPVLAGGPVQTDQLLLVAFRWHPQTQRLECRHHISLEEAERLVSAQHHTVRGFIGYTGWSGGQLEGELAHRSWLVCKADQADLLETERAPRIWSELTSTFGPWFKLVAEAPDDPSVN